MGNLRFMVALQRVWEVLVGAWVAAILARALLVWILDAEGWWVQALIVGAGLVGGLAAMSEARPVEPLSPAAQRDAVIGWGGLAAAVAVIACLAALPGVWGPVVAALIAGTAFVGLLLYARGHLTH